MNDQRKGLLVVGVDHSDGAKAALTFAIEEAVLRDARLRAVHAWQTGVIGAVGFEATAPDLGGDITEIRAAATAALQESLRAAGAESSGVEVEAVAVQGSAARVLIEQSQRADLVIVGSRGHGGFAQLLLGSVSQQCASRAACPVVIVRSTRGSAA